MAEASAPPDATSDPPLRMQAVGLLAAGLAHDLNTMLGGILATAELMAARLPSDSPLQDDLSLIVGQAERMGALIRQLLAFSRQEVLKPVHLDLAAFLARIAPHLRTMLGSHVTLTLPTSACAAVTVDPGALERVLVNLIANARDAIGTRPGRIVVGCGRLARGHDLPAYAAGIVPPGDWAILWVADDGPGVPPELRARIFEPYFTTKPEGQGYGLGLAVAYGLVKQSGGFLLLDPDVSAGARFVIFLPLATTGPEDRPRPPADADAPVILLAEDEETLRNCARRGLESAGYRVIAVPDGAKAEEAFVNHPEVRLLVSDVRMPGTDGVTLARRLRRRRPDLPVLLMSGYADAAERASLADLDVAFLPKPFRLADLRSSVANLL